jgi:hypothetical protein
LVGFLITSDVALRLAFRDRVGDVSLMLTGIFTPLALVGWAALTLAVVVWLRILRSYQVSFFYPLWGMVPLGVFVVQSAVFGGGFSWQALLGAGLMILGGGLLIRGGHSV